MISIYKHKASLAMLKRVMLNQKGFTLVEVLIALLVLGILFVPVSNAFLQSVHLNQHLQQRVTAVREAQTAMEVSLSVMNSLDLSESIKPEEEAAKDNEEQIANLFVDIDTAELITADTSVEIAPLHEDSPFFVITATSSYAAKDAHNDITLTTLHLPGEAPWLTPKEYRVVTP